MLRRIVVLSLLAIFFTQIAYSWGFRYPGRGWRHPGRWGYPRHGWGYGTGFFLDSNDPTYRVELNQLPMDPDLAEKAGVTLDTIQRYNENLEKVRENAIPFHNAISSLMNPSEKNQDADHQLLVANMWGFESVKQFRKTIETSLMGADILKIFAEYTNLEIDVARLMLYAGFDIHIG